MAYDEDCALVVLYRLFQRLLGVNVKVIGGLVKNETMPISIPAGKESLFLLFSIRLPLFLIMK